MRRTSAYRGLARTIDSLACQALRGTTCGAPAAAVRRSGTSETGLRTVSVRARVTRPLVRTWTATARPTQTGAPFRHAGRVPALEAAGSGPSCSSARAVHQADQRPAVDRVRTLHAARSLPVHADELERARVARRAQRALLSQRDLAHLERGETGARRGREGERERAEQEQSAHGRRSVAHEGFSDKAAGPPLTQCLRHVSGSRERLVRAPGPPAALPEASALVHSRRGRARGASALQPPRGGGRRGPPRTAGRGSGRRPARPRRRVRQRRQPGHPELRPGRARACRGGGLRGRRDRAGHARWARLLDARDREVDARGRGGRGRLRRAVRARARTPPAP